MRSLGLSDNIAAMDDPRWLRLITIGLVLAALAVGYFLLTGRLSSNTTKTSSQVSKAIPSSSPTVTPSPAIIPTPSPISAYEAISNRTQGTPQTLPKTGLPVGLMTALSVSIIIAGWGLRRFPH